MLHFEGEKYLPVAAGELWTKLSDARFLVERMPDVVAVAQAEPAVAAFTLRPGFSFVRGTLETKLEVFKTVPGAEVRMLVASKGIGSSSSLEAVLSFASQGADTTVRWSADIIQLGGLLKAVPQGLIRASAQKVISDVWTSIESHLAKRS